MKKLLLSILLTGWLGLSMAQTIQKVEYFIDTDPGFGNAINLPFTAGESVVIPLNIPVSNGFLNGLHKFYIRAKDSNGRWSFVYAQNFFKASLVSDDLSTISQLEYFIDNDPGVGQAVIVPINSGTSVTKALSIPIAANLPPGFHKFFIRAKNANGLWSIIYNQNFFKIQDSADLQNIVKLEYFFNNDPGFGQGTPLAITPGTKIDLQSQVFNIDNSISTGQHRFYLRAQDAEGKWSLVASETITVCEIGATITATPSLNSCGTAVTLTANITNPTPNSLTWQWMRDGRFIGFENSNSINVTESGNYNIQMSNGNNGACDVVNSGIAEVNIKRADTLVIQSDSKASICGSSVHVEIDGSVSQLSDRFGFSYQWFRNEVPFSTAEEIDITQGGSYKLKLSYLGGFSGCQPIESNVLNISSKVPLLAIGPLSEEPNIIEVCQDSEIRLSAVTDLHPLPSFQWYKNNLPLAGETAKDLLVSNAAGSYHVEMTSGCVGVESVKYNLTYKLASSSPFSISLLEGMLSSCPGTVAEIGVTGCTGNILWSNGATGNTLRVAQQNTPTSYSANCMGSCLSSSSNTLTFSPSAPTLSPPVIEVEMLPVSRDYKEAKHPVFYQQYAFRYADFLPPVGTVPTANGDIFYSDAFFDLHLIKNNIEQSTQPSLLIRNESVAATASDMIVLQDDLFLTVGFSSANIGHSKSQNSIGGDDFWLLARDKDGTRIWDQTFGGTSTDKAISVIQNTDGNVFVFGESSSGVNGNKTSPAFGSSDIWVVVIDAFGQKLADYSFGGSGAEKFKSAVLLSNGNILMIGSSASGISGNKTTASFGGEDVWLVCIDVSGNIQWQKTIGTSNTTESGLSAVEKDGFIYLIANNHKIYKLDQNGNELKNKVVDFDLYFVSNLNPPTHTTDLHGIYKTSQDGILLTSRLYGSATTGVQGGTLTYPYDSFVIFEIDDTLGIIQETIGTYGSTNTDKLGKCFFDIQGDFHLIKDGQVFSCPENGNPIWYTYYVDQSAENNIHCNLPSDNFYGWYQWILSPYMFEERNFVDHCRETEFLLRARTINSAFEGQPEFLWSTGEAGAIIKVTPEIRIPISLSYKPKNLQNFCGSPVSNIDLFPYKNYLSITGLNDSDASLSFAHEELYSTEHLQISKNYQSEGSIFLQPGFQITASAQKVFEAKIDGCLNE